MKATRADIKVGTKLRGTTRCNGKFSKTNRNMSKGTITEDNISSFLLRLDSHLDTDSWNGIEYRIDREDIYRFDLFEEEPVRNGDTTLTEKNLEIGTLIKGRGYHNSIEKAIVLRKGGSSFAIKILECSSKRHEIGKEIDFSYSGLENFILYKREEKGGTEMQKKVDVLGDFLPTFMETVGKGYGLDDTGRYAIGLNGRLAVKNSAGEFVTWDKVNNRADKTLGAEIKIPKMVLKLPAMSVGIDDIIIDTDGNPVFVNRIDQDGTAFVFNPFSGKTEMVPKQGNILGVELYTKVYNPLSLIGVTSMEDFMSKFQMKNAEGSIDYLKLGVLALGLAYVSFRFKDQISSLGISLEENSFLTKVLPVACAVGIAKVISTLENKEGMKDLIPEDISEVLKKFKENPMLSLAAVSAVVLVITQGLSKKKAAEKVVSHFDFNKSWVILLIPIIGVLIKKLTDKVTDMGLTMEDLGDMAKSGIEEVKEKFLPTLSAEETVTEEDFATE